MAGRPGDPSYRDHSYRLWSDLGFTAAAQRVAIQPSDDSVMTFDGEHSRWPAPFS
jgi:hypothetical protein